MSLSSHPENEAPSDTQKRLNGIAKRYRRVATKLEFLQTYVFPDLFKPYDNVATNVGPDIMDNLIKHGFLMGEIGLLEVMESYHQYVKQLPVFRILKAGKSNSSACVAKLLKILLTHIYGETIDPLPLKNTRKPYIHHTNLKTTRKSKESYIKVVHEYDGIGCVCGRSATFSDCQYCNYGQIEKLDKLCEDSCDYLLEGKGDLDQILKDKEKLVKNVWMKGNGVNVNK